MGCIINEGVTLNCAGYTVGGINKIYLANLEDIASYTLNLDGSIEEIVMVATKVFYKFEFADTTGLTTSEFQNNAGTKNFLHGVGLSIPKMSQDIINTMQELGLSKVVALIESRESRDVAPFLGQNRWHVYGAKNGLTVTTMTSGSGQAQTDFSGFVVVLNGTETSEMIELVPNSVTYTTIQAYVNTLD